MKIAIINESARMKKKDLIQVRSEFSLQTSKLVA
jgi:hypothetical protein